MPDTVASLYGAAHLLNLYRGFIASANLGFPLRDVFLREVLTAKHICDLLPFRVKTDGFAIAVGQLISVAVFHNDREFYVDAHQFITPVLRSITELSPQSN